MERLQMQQCARQTYDSLLVLPCQVEDMTPREFAIYRLLAIAMQALNAIAQHDDAINQEQR